MIKVRASLIAFLFVAALPAAFAAPAKSASSSKQTGVRDIHKALDIWLAAVRTGNSRAVMELYAKNAILLPTLSPTVANTPELRKKYFDVFTAKKNLRGKVTEEHLRVYSDFAVNSGLYTFTYTDNKAIVTVPARFTYVYRKTDKGWLIIDHHSSKLPPGH